MHELKSMQGRHLSAYLHGSGEASGSWQGLQEKRSPGTVGCQGMVVRVGVAGVLKAIALINFCPRCQERDCFLEG
jgi:hypothetical protein